MKTNVDELFNKIENLPLSEMLILCGNAIESKIGEKKIETLLVMLETRLQKIRLMNMYGIKEPNKSEGE